MPDATVSAMRERPGAPRVESGAGTYILSPDGKLLLIDAEGSDRVRLWISPGGGLEQGETIEQCAVREAYEETGLRVRLVRLLAVSEVWHAGRMAILGFLFLAEPDPWPQQPAPPDADGALRFHGCGWFDRADIASLNVPQDELYLRMWPDEITMPVMQRFETTPEGWKLLPDGWQPPLLAP